MTEWDSRAAAHLQDVVAGLRGLEVAQLLEEQVRTIWRRNVDAFDPQLGDTSLSLGVTCSENLRQLVLRQCADARSAWRERGVTATTVDRSLRVEARGVRLGVMKAPPSQRRTPDWTGAAFRWEQESDVRRAAAERNSTAYRPADSDQTGRQLALATSDPGASATDMCDLLVVWSGHVEPALTAGWVGLPSLDRPGWFAVEPLWWEEPGKDVGRRHDNPPPSDRPGFADLPAARPHVALKRRPGAALDQQP